MSDSAAVTATVDQKAIGATAREAVISGDFAVLGRLAATLLPSDGRGTTSTWMDSAALWLRQRAAVGV
jgi:hypothetical protein